MGALDSVWLVRLSASLLGVGGLARRRRGRQAGDAEHAAADPPVRTASGVNRRRRDHVPVVGLDHLAGA
jgi:hypothetical protein